MQSERRQSKKQQQQQLAPLRATGSTSVVVRTEYHEVVLDLASTHFLFTIPADAPPAGSSTSRALQVGWVHHRGYTTMYDCSDTPTCSKYTR